MDYKKLVDELEDYFDIYTDLHPAIFDEAATAITDLLARAEEAEAELIRKESYYNQMVDALAATDSFEKQKLCEEADHLKDLLKEAEARAEKAEHDMKRIVNRSSYPCEYCTKEKCFATDMKRLCYDFTWDSSQKEE